MQTAAEKFEYKEIDREGLETLDVIASADKFNEWMFDTIKPHCKGTILEIGSGTGNISRFFLRDGFAVMLSDIRKQYCRILGETFNGNTNLLGVQLIDLVLPDFDVKHKDLIGNFDTVVALNVVEHIEDDLLAIANAKKLLSKKGTLIVLVPAYQWLYNRLDKELYHFCRYTKGTLGKLFLKNDLAIKTQLYFNALGMAGWIVSGKMLRKKIIPRTQMSFYNKIVPVARLLDVTLFRQMGLSVIVVGEK